MLLCIIPDAAQRARTMDASAIAADRPIMNSGYSLVPRLRAALDAAADRGALLEAKLRERLKVLGGEGEANPFAHPLLQGALEISRMLDQGQATLDDLDALVRRMAVRSFADRAEKLGRYLQDVAVPENEVAIAGLIATLAGDPPIPFADFQKKIELAVFGIVLTAHPTFGRPVELARTLNAIVTSTDEGGTLLDADAAQAALDRALTATHLPPESLTLEVEHRWSMEALGHIQDAIDRVSGIVFDVAAELYPDDWQRLRPGLVTAASWVGYDLDGRSDIAWSETISKRLLVKRAQLDLLLARARMLATQSDAIAPYLATVTEALGDAVTATARQIDVLKIAPEGYEALGQVTGVFLETREAALVSTRSLVARLDEAVPLAPGHALQRDLSVLRNALDRHGLGLAHTHVRLNSAQLHNAIRKQIGMESAPNDPAHRRTYMTTINDLLGRVKPETINFAVLTDERTTAKRLFMIVQQFTKYIDAETPVRFLIAETEAGFTLLTALYFARLFGVEDRVEISPLFETAEAIERGDAILDDALKSPHYRDYVRKIGRICIQFGFSDSGRYLGQMAASFLLERLRLRFGAVLAKHELADVQLVLFNTNGESIGRGGHPASLADRMRYLSPPVTRTGFAAQGIPLKEEMSFQGGDGFQLFMGLPAALSVVRVGLEALLLPDPEAERDPVYGENDFAVEFFATIRQSFGSLVDDPNYAALLGAYGSGLTPRTGSRPMRRQHEGALRGLDVTHVSQLRAIPNNTVLQQLGLMANTIYGLGAARARDPELFDQLRRTSPRFRRAMDMVAVALGASDLDILRAYIDTFDPGLWLTRSGRTRSLARAAELRTVADHLERLELHQPLMKLFHRFQADFLLLTERPEAPAGGLAGKLDHRQDLLLLHLIRLTLIHRIYLLAIHVPDFAPRHGVSRDVIIAQLLRLDVPIAVATLKDIFPKAEPAPLPEAALAEPATYRGDPVQGYAREHATLFDPMLRLYRLNLILGNAIGAVIGAVG